MHVGCFPFWTACLTVAQVDRDPKPVFVLGVYGSAVHARWTAPDGSERVKALAVASEPEPFWRGEDAAAIVARVQAPAAVGALQAAEHRFNGASGRALDELILTPLGLRRSLTWLCDLVPHSCANAQQLAAIAREYAPLAAAHDLPAASVPPIPATFADHHRAQAIAAELAASTASLLILLGDDPIQHFLHVFDRRYTRLGDFGRSADHYGRLHRVTFEGRRVQVLPLAHPRQIARLGQSSSRWYDLHQTWLATADRVL
jgi:uracil-DNA glycosylase